MDYLILECAGEKTSEYRFWREVLGFMGDIICVGGNTRLFYVLGQLSTQVNTGDNIYLCYDSINKYSTVHSITVRNNIQSIEKQFKSISIGSNVNCFMLKDLCFESMIYRLETIIPGIRLLQMQLNAAYRGGQVYDTVLALMFNQLCNNCTCEQYMANILHLSTYRTNLRVTKGELGRCWTSDCGYTNFRGQLRLKSVTVENHSYICSKQTCVLCGHLLSALSNNVFDNCKTGFKRDMVLSELCNGDWHNLFKCVNKSKQAVTV